MYVSAIFMWPDAHCSKYMQFHVIFDDIDQEVENEQDDDEFDEPILEEEEDEDITPSWITSHPDPFAYFFLPYFALYLYHAFLLSSQIDKD